MTRAFQDWGDLDMYEFQLHCDNDAERAATGGGGRGGGEGGEGGGEGVGLAKPPTAFGSRATSKEQEAAWLRELREWSVEALKDEL